MSPTFPEALRVWLRVAVQSFGGPAGQIAVMHRILVEEKGWVSEERFLHALNYCMLLPGPEAQQLAVYLGWLLNRTPGGLAAGCLFVLPGFLSILVLSTLYASFSDTRFVQSLFYGVKAAIVVVVIEALLRIGKRALKTRGHVALAGFAFVAIFFFQTPFPAIVVSAGLTGFLIRDRSQPVPPDVARPSGLRTLRVASFWLALWLIPVGALYWLLGPGHVLVQEGLFFSRAAVVTFGGAYAVLSYLAQEAVHTYGWLRPGEMLDGLGMAETTPGPLIQVVQFVAFMGAYRHPGGMDPLTAGLLGSLVATWVTYVPSFLWIFTGAPYIEFLRGQKSLTSALSCITAAVVGVILNLTVWFSLHTLFGQVHEGPGVVPVPVWSSLDPLSLLITLAAAVAILRFHVGLIPTLLAAAGLGLLLHP